MFSGAVLSTVRQGEGASAPATTATSQSVERQWHTPGLRRGRGS